MSPASGRSEEQNNSGVSLSEEIDTKPSRKRKFANKTRLGCVNCKKRRIRCGQETPTCQRCAVAGLECSYKPPKTWLFVPKDALQSCSGSSTSSCSKPGHDPWSHYLHADHRTGLTSHHGEEAGLLITQPSQTLFTSQHEYQAFGSWFCFLVNYAEPRSCFIGSTTEFWLELIPQAAFGSSALRYAMIAGGYMALSLARKEVGAPEMESRRMTLSYANQAIRALACQSHSILETVLTAWTFWQLEVLDGNLKSALIHMTSAIKIVQHAPPGNDSNGIAKSFVEGMTSGVSTPLKHETGSWSPFGKADSVDERKRRAVKTLTEAFPQLESCSQRVLASNIPAKIKLLAILDEACQEVQWCLKKWLTLDEYVVWRARADNANQHEVSAPSGLFYNVVQDLNEHLSGSEDFVVDEWEQLVYRNFLVLFLSAVTPDLPFRHEMFDFMEFARQLREPRRPTLGHVRPLPFSCSLLGHPPL
ncbi:hypothetical protein H2200_012491 [Cladophialophora chaetospira]|uniref:Zn(2)-C6 fungal-type domain-containing protein n=1 Tax=Cladophialophora chaetospira TaxID=386627 RepID=A0AA38WY05_9EURO|nr:hypothetical protein H2200_012491 [Cladophialophora chaetospira]